MLVNNAGVGFTPRRLELEDPDEHRRTIDVNLNGVYLGMRAVTPVMTAQRAGSIVNISSIDGLVGVAGMTSYAASKFAVTGMTRTTALELGPRGIRVNSIHPGVIETPMVAAAPEETKARLKVVLDRQAIPRMGTPEEVAYLALFLASDESSYCTGAQFVIDGGHLAGPVPRRLRRRQLRARRYTRPSMASQELTSTPGAGSTSRLVITPSSMSAE